MTKAINNYDKTKISMAHVFLQYDQATMIHKYSLPLSVQILLFPKKRSSVFMENAGRSKFSSKPVNLC